MALLKLIRSYLIVAAVTSCAVAMPGRRPPSKLQRVQVHAPPPAEGAGFELRRLEDADIDVDGRSRQAVRWRVEADPEFLAALPQELWARGADPSSGAMTLVLRMEPGHPVVARIEMMIRGMFSRWSGTPSHDAAFVPAGPPVEPALAGEDPCISACRIYSCDGDANLLSTDDLGRTFTLIGNMGAVMFDLAVSRDRRLYGISFGDLYVVNACTAEATLLGPTSLGASICGDRASDGLFAGAPPLERIPLPQTTPDVIGGFCCGAPPAWCSDNAGDITASNVPDRLHAALQSPSCVGNVLVTIDSITGDFVEEVGCLHDRWTLVPLSFVAGLAFDPCSCTILVGSDNSPVTYVVNPATGVGEANPVGGPYIGTYGFATLPTDVGSCPPTCAAAAEAPACWSTQLHANASDPDGDPLTYAWSSMCADASFAPSADVADPVATVDPGCRSCSFDLVVADGHGGTCQGDVEVTFVGEAPVVEATTLVSCLWPPNHALMDVGLAATVSGGCAQPGDVALSIVSVTSDESAATAEGAGGAAHCPDAVVDGLSVRLRAERSGASDGRVYRITVKAVDPCGNAAETSVEVVVPHDAGGRRAGPCAAVDGGEQDDATACD